MTDQAIELESRTARLFFHLGYLARQRVALKSYFYPEPVDVTDIDAYGIKWDFDFSPRIVVSQCRTGRAKSQEKPANSILWLRGLKELTQASQAYLVMPAIPQRLKTFAQINGLVTLDYGRLDELEKTLGIDHWFGSLGPDIFKMKVDVWNEITSDRSKQFSPHYWFLVSDFWSMPNNVRIKRCISHVERLVKYSSLNNLHSRWLLAESVILLSVALLSFCHEVFAMSPENRKRFIEVKMIEGLGTVEDEEKILQYVNALVASIVEEQTGQKVKPDPTKMKMLAPTYTPSLVETIERMLNKADLGVQVPRFLDVFLYEFALTGRPVDRDLLHRVFHLEQDKLEVVAKLGKNIVRFLDSSADTRPLFQSLMTF